MNSQKISRPISHEWEIELQSLISLKNIHFFLLATLFDNTQVAQISLRTQFNKQTNIGDQICGIMLEIIIIMSLQNIICIDNLLHLQDFEISLGL